MPLARASDRFVMRERHIHFLMKDDSENELICSISSNTLLALGQTVGHPAFIFLAFRDRIERAAIDKYERTVRVTYEILAIQERDLPPGAGEAVLSHPAMK
jgi:hypothetical protein